jgi:Flp pilus assembly protein TadD
MRRRSFLSHKLGGPGWRKRFLLALGYVLMASGSMSAEERQLEAKLVDYRGRVQWIHNGLTNEVHPDLPLYAGDTVQTLKNSTAVVWSRKDNSLSKLHESTGLEIATSREDSSPLLHLLRGAFYFFSRERSHEARIFTPHFTGAVRGTEFVITVYSNRTELAMLDGEATLTNTRGTTNLLKGQLGVAFDGSAPIRTVLEAKNLVQWYLYYPGVLDLDELVLSASEKEAWARSLEAYRFGDLPKALEAAPGYPDPAAPETDSGRIYLAGLYLAAGQVDKAEGLLNQLSAESSLATALRRLIAAVQLKVDTEPQTATTASEWLGLSYYLQARDEPKRLEKALWAATNALAKSPNFAFGLERVAELEFGFGRIRRAKEALDKSLVLAPRNAQAHALNGFLLSAQNRIGEAKQEFQKAIELDSGLGNAWLGRGLVRIRTGDASGGWSDLQTAVILEPNRSLLRSYLGKAFADAGQDRKATLEFQRAIGLDTNDPTPWFYSALLIREQFQINEAVTDLEHSIELNENRAVYRSQFLLDEDRAARSSSLASIYQADGMNEVSVREAAKAVSYDYANYSAHLFLSESYDALRDPTRFNLRYETAWFNELLLANLLSPVGGTPLSQHISQQEYARLFERDRIGLTSDSEYWSDGKFHELASQYGTVNKFGWALDLDYHYQPNTGERDRPNNGLDSIEWYTQVKYQVTPQSSLFLLTKYQDYHSGDNFQYYDPSAVRVDLTNYGIFNAPVVRTNFTFDETQKPIVLGGYHYEWAPGIHTLALAGRLSNKQVFSDSLVPELVFQRGPDFGFSTLPALTPPFAINYSSTFEAGTAEVEQIFQSERQLLEIGGRFQGGEIKTTDQLVVDPSLPPDYYTNVASVFNTPAAAANVSETFQRETVYGYYSVYPLRNLALTVGLAYDRVEYPENFRNPPIAAGTETKYQLEPKAALVYSAADWIALRAAYAHSLGGVSLDESFRLERTELAGFIQTFRSVIPESVSGSLSAPTFDTYNAALDVKLRPGTYITLDGGMISSDVDRQIGVFNYVSGPNAIAEPGLILQRLRFKEPSAGIVVNQLVSTEWSGGLGYRFTSSQLHLSLPEVPSYVLGDIDQRADLHRFSAYLLFNHPCGLFAGAEANYFHQDNSGNSFESGSAAKPANSDFPQFNLFAGWRFPRQRGDFTFGVLNVAGRDYHLNPLNSYPELPRDRVFTIRLRFRL